MRRENTDFFDRYGPDARADLHALLDKYADHGPDQFTIPETLTVPPISEHGNVAETAGKFGGADKLMEAVSRLQELLYAA